MGRTGCLTWSTCPGPGAARTSPRRSIDTSTMGTPFPTATTRDFCLHARLAERMKALLEERGLFPALEGAYASCVLSHMASLLTYLIFDPRRERPFAQRRALCEELRETAVFQEALEHNRPRESLRRWVYLFAFQRRWYHTAGLICRVMHLRLRHTTQREREAAP